MSHLFLKSGFSAKSWLFSTQESSPLTPGAWERDRQRTGNRAVLMPRQRRYFGGTNRPSGRWSKSRVWLCCAGAAVAFAVGQHYRSEPNNGDPGGESPREEPRMGSRYGAAIQVSRDLVRRIQAEVGAPGVAVGVSVDGVQVWCEGMGYADLENRVPCGPDTVMRIASISKSLTAAAAARLCEEGKLDLDEPVQKYVPEFPQKQFNGEDVTITPRMILSHLSGIRHYEKDAGKVTEKREKAKRLLKPSAKEKDDEKAPSTNVDKSAERQSGKDKEAVRDQKKEFEHEEYYLKDNFDSVTRALDLFKDDPLIFKPGTTFLYSTHAFTLLSAAVERAAGQPFLDVMTNLFRELGMLNTVPDQNEPLVYHRSRFYHVNKRGRVVNCPYVDNSYKWAGGGFLSTAGDLLLFGNALLYSYQLAQLEDGGGLLPGFLKPKTSLDQWRAVTQTEGGWDKDGQFAQGWLVVENGQKYGQCRKRRHYASHTGGAVGASSVLLVLPADRVARQQGRSLLPQGVVVAVLTNMQSVGLNGTALKIALEFDKARGL